jgi:hypothetical protein
VITPATRDTTSAGSRRSTVFAWAICACCVLFAALAGFFTYLDARLVPGYQILEDTGYLIALTWGTVGAFIASPSGEQCGLVSSWRRVWGWAKCRLHKLRGLRLYPPPRSAPAATRGLDSWLLDSAARSRHVPGVHALSERLPPIHSMAYSVWHCDRHCGRAGRHRIGGAPHISERAAIALCRESYWDRRPAPLGWLDLAARSAVPARRDHRLPLNHPGTAEALGRCGAPAAQVSGLHRGSHDHGIRRRTGGQPSWGK